MRREPCAMRLKVGHMVALIIVILFIYSSSLFVSSINKSRLRRFNAAASSTSTHNAADANITPELWARQPRAIKKARAMPLIPTPIPWQPDPNQPIGPAPQQLPLQQREVEEEQRAVDGERIMEAPLATSTQSESHAQSEEMKQAISGPRPLVLAGPSGAGKSTLVKRVMARWPNSFGFSISHTTRSIRPSEQNGVHYHFTNLDAFNQLKAEGGFIETAVFSSNHYGTSKQAVRDVMESGKICILDIDIQGVLQMKQTNLNPHYIFIAPPSMEELERRLRARGDTAPEAIEERLRTAKGELEYTKRDNFWDIVLVNDDLDTADRTLQDWLAKNYSL